MADTSPYWWTGDSRERYWCEITDRPDIGDDLKCPQTDESQKPYWSYGLIRHVWPGDIVFHYSTRVKAFVGASVAGGPLQDRAIVWTPHGTVGRAKHTDRDARPGWWLPLYHYTRAADALTLAHACDVADLEWVREWIAVKKERFGRVAAPFQRYGSGLRGAQGYLTKMPADFVERWPQLSQLAGALCDVQDDLAALTTSYPASGETHKQEDFNPKSSEDYLVLVRGGVQRKTRTHERLVKTLGETLRSSGASVSTPHPIDLRMSSPVEVIFEVKAVGRSGVLRAVREAVGQVLEYRHFVGPRSASLAVAINAVPSAEVVSYVERTLEILLLWITQEGLFGGAAAVQALGFLGVRSRHGDDPRNR